MEQVVVSFAPLGSLPALQVEGARQTSCRWLLEDLKPPGSYVAALVAEGSFLSACWQWEGDRVFSSDELTATQNQV